MSPVEYNITPATSILYGVMIIIFLIGVGKILFILTLKKMKELFRSF